MVHKFQNIYGTMYVVQQSQDFKNEIEKLFTEIKIEKNYPFNKIFLKIPIFLYNVISIELEKYNIKIKNFQKVKDMILVEI
jgi:hypothetical protein